MTTVEILYRYSAPPSDSVSTALAGVRDVYGIRQLRFDRAAATLRVEYDATRLSAAAVTRLVRQAGLDVSLESSELGPPNPPQIAPAAG